MAETLIGGRYRLLSELGHGGMSRVWLAEDTELARRVAVKILAPTADRDRFDREARAVAALSHPNIAALYDYGEDDGKRFMVLEYLPGGSLDDRLRAGGPLPDAVTRRLAGEVAAGLAHAHERGLVHRDLKPANILFDAEGRAKLVDFGIARMGGSHTLTEAGTVLGTASTISPEQAAGEIAGPPSDVYSFGVILFRMLTGALPFLSANAMELVRMHRDEPPPTVASRRPDAPADLAAVADASLAKDPARRPADGTALLALVAGAEPPTMVVAPPAAADEATRVLVPPAAARRRGRRSALLAALAALALAGAGIAAALVLTRGSNGGSAPPPSAPRLHLPSVSTAPSLQASDTLPTTSTVATGRTTSSEATTTARTSTAHTTTAEATTAGTTTGGPATTARTTTAQTTTARTTTAETTTAQTTTAQTTTTAPATTAPTTTAATTAAATTAGQTTTP